MKIFSPYLIQCLLTNSLVLSRPQIYFRPLQIGSKQSRRISPMIPTPKPSNNRGNSFLVEMKSGFALHLTAGICTCPAPIGPRQLSPLSGQQNSFLNNKRLPSCLCDFSFDVYILLLISLRFNSGLF